MGFFLREVIEKEGEEEEWVRVREERRSVVPEHRKRQEGKR